MLHVDSPAVTAEATKHHGKLAQIVLTLRPPEHGSFGAACLSYTSSRHTGDAGGSVAEIRQPVLVRYSRLCFSKLDNAGHGPRYASFTSEYPRRNLAPPNAISLTPALRAEQAISRQPYHDSPMMKRSQLARPAFALAPSLPRSARGTRKSHLPILGTFHTTHNRTGRSDSA